MKSFAPIGSYAVNRCLILFLLIFNAQFASLKAQQPLTGFTCTFDNPDVTNAIACGSVVTATINYPSQIGGPQFDRLPQ